METIKNYFADINEKSLVLVISLLLLISPILYISSLHNPSHVPRIALLSFLSVIGILIYLFSLWKSKNTFHFHKIHMLLLLFLFWATISITWTIDFGNFAYEIIPLWAYIGLFFITSYIADFKIIKLLITVSIIGAFYAAIIALLQNYGINPEFIKSEKYGMNSTFGFKNHFALYLDIIIPAALCLLIILENIKLRWLLAILTGILLGVYLELHTRGSWVTLASWLIIFFIFLFLTRKESRESIHLITSKKFELISVVIISIIILLPHGQIDKEWKRNVPEGQIIDNSSKYRLQMYYNSLNMIKDNPLTGVGYGAFWKGFRSYMNHPELIKKSDAHNYIYRLHNDPLQYFTELGFPGGILILIIFLYVLYMGYKLYFKLDQATHKILVLGLTMSILACGGHSLIDFPLHKPSSAIQFWVSLGMLSGLYIKQFSVPSIPKKFYLALSLLITLLYSTVATAFHVKNIKGNYYHRLSTLTTDCKDATRYMDLSIKEGGFYLLSHARRVSIHIKCKTPAPQLLEIINDELAWDPTNIKALYFRGQILMNSGYHEQALNDFTKVMYILPHRSPAKIAVVSVLLKMERKDEAIKLTQQIIKQHPEIEDAKKLLEEISQ